MNEADFSNIAKHYEKTSLVQKAASAVLFDLLNIQPNEKVLDLGCGPGHLSARLAQITKATVTGLDTAEGMVRKARETYQDQKLVFLQGRAEDMSYENDFDVIFCNSVFHWFIDPIRVLRQCLRSLKPNGRMGIQAPGSNNYCPQFIQAIRQIKTNENTKEIFRHFKSPWFFGADVRSYIQLFESARLKVIYAKIHQLEHVHSIKEIFEIFRSGAVAGYLNQQYYDIAIDDCYRREFVRQFESSIREQAQGRDKLTLTFNRIFLVAEKETNDISSDRERSEL